jgi:murein L,D-transpeptidase YafK
VCNFNFMRLRYKNMIDIRSFLFNRGLTLAIAMSSVVLSGCVQEDYLPTNSRHYVPIPPSTLKLMSEKVMAKESPILIRSYKQESEFEIWKRGSDGKYALLKTYPMCRWSGQLGPKKYEGDRQVPEGFYSLTPSQLNPNSSYYVAMNVGYPNALDKAYGRTGGLIMVHGACSSAGCMSMTDEQMAEIYALTREAFTGGQQQIQIQSMPFRMTPKNFAKFRADPNLAFWKNLKEGMDHFEVTKQEPKVAACSKKYVFNASAKGRGFDASQACPPMEVDAALASAVAEKAHEDDAKTAQLASAGEHAVRRVYVDGDQHHTFRNTSTADGTVRTRAGRHVSVSQMSALEGVHEVKIEDAHSKVVKIPAATQKTAVIPTSIATVVTSKPALSTSSVITPIATKNIGTAPLTPIIPSIIPVPKGEEPAIVSSVSGNESKSALYKRWFGASEASRTEEAHAEASMPVETIAPQSIASPLQLKSPPQSKLPAKMTVR